MNTNTLTTGTPTSWSASTPAREQFGIAPYGAKHGTAVPVAGMTHAARPAVLTDAAKVPDPRERKR
jgi:hypothetical protein